MSAGNDWFRSLLRPVPEPDEDREPSTPPSFDGGARSPVPAPPPSMNQLIRRAQFGNVAGTDDRPQPPEAA